MTYKQIESPHNLRQWVRYFWILENDGDTTPNQILRPLADGCPGIIFQNSATGTFRDGVNKQIPEIFLYGQTVTCAELLLEGAFKTVGVCFYPSALNALFQFDASELTNSCVDFTLLMNNLKEQLLNSQSPSDRIEIFSSRLWDLIRKREPAIDLRTEFALKQIIGSNGNIKLRSLQKELQLSERGLQRKFNQHVGISPKLFARVCRFQASLARLNNNDFDNLSDIAFDNGYADQSHFIRAFKEFAGFSPLNFKNRQKQLTPNFSIA